MAAFIITFSTSKTLPQVLRRPYHPTTLQTHKTLLRKPYILHTACNTLTTLRSGPWTGIRSATSSPLAPMTASLVSGHAPGLAIQTTSTTGTTLAKPQQKLRVPLTAAKADDRRWKKKNRKQRMKQKAWLTRNSRLGTWPVRPSFPQVSHSQDSLHHQMALQVLSQVLVVQANILFILLRHHLHRQECPSRPNQTQAAHPFLLPSQAWTHLTLLNSLPLALCRPLRSLTATVRLHLMAETLLLLHFLHPRISLVSPRECRRVCRLFPMVCLLLVSLAFRLHRLLVDWAVLRRRQGGLVNFRCNSRSNSNNNRSSSKDLGVEVGKVVQEAMMAW